MTDVNEYSDEKLSAVHNLEGITLKSGWKVLEKVSRTPISTGGSFSVCYIVEKDGQKGFLKALNLKAFLRDEQKNIAESLAEMLNTFNYEKDVLLRCKNKNFSKISKLLEAAEENFKGYLISNVLYMIFELADNDVRHHLKFAGDMDTAWKLRSLHHIATGLKQLHSIDISHQDLKPSNVFVFENTVSKLGDLGRSLCSSLSAPHSGRDFSGDYGYAPPEVFHSYALPEWRDKVFAVDTYLLGSMTVFYFTGQNMTSLLLQSLEEDVNVYTLKFEEAFPYWIIAFESAINIFDEHIANIDNRGKIIELVRMLCFPDPRKRGHIKNFVENGSNYRLHRIIETFNLLATQAEYKLTKAK